MAWRDYERAGMLFPVRLPGGDAAIREPWRMACAWLVAASGEQVPRHPAALVGEVDRSAWEAVCELVATGLNSPPTTSVGTALRRRGGALRIRARVNYEGQAAAELEGVSDPAEHEAVPAAADRRARGGSAGTLILDARETVRAIARDLEHGDPCTDRREIPRGAGPSDGRSLQARGGAHAAPTWWSSRAACSRTGCCSSGRDGFVDEAGLRVLAPTRLPPNDGGIAYGQVAVAAARLRAGQP